MSSNIIKNPRVTEKGAYKAEANVYTFDVIGSATKNEIKKANFGLYKVKPVQVNVLAVPGKKRMLRGKASLGAKTKKAFVYLKKGDKIDFV